MPRSNFGPRGELFRKLVREMRTDATLTQAELAARLNRPQSFVAKYENGERRLDVVEFIEVAEAIGFDPAEFVRALSRQTLDALPTCGEAIARSGRSRT